MQSLSDVALAAVLVVSAAGAEDPGEVLTRGRLESDLGRHGAAAAIFAEVAEADGATGAQRREALARLGAALRETGDAEASADAFATAWEERGEDPEEIRLLLQAVGAALPGEERWREVWRDVRLVFEGSGAARRVRAVWPGVPDAPCGGGGHEIDLDFKKENLGDVFRLFADTSGLNFVVAPGTRGEVSYTGKGLPWQRALCQALAPSGYVAERVGNVVWVSLPEHAPPRRTFVGDPIDVEFFDVALVDALAQIASEAGLELRVEAGVSGQVTLVLHDVAWDQTFHLVAHLNRVRWEREGDTLVVLPR